MVRALKRCSHCKLDFLPGAVRACLHPAVNRVYGRQICYYCCRKCRWHEDTAAGIGCKYPVDSGERK